MVADAACDLPASHADEVPPSGAGRRAYPEPTGRQAEAPTNLQTGDFILLLPTNKKGVSRAERFRFAHVQSDAEPRIAPQHRADGDDERRATFGVAVALLRSAPTHEMRINADPRIVHEHAAVDLADVDLDDSAGKGVAAASS